MTEERPQEAHSRDGRWQPVRTEDGSWTLLHPVHGEGCHNRAGAWLEAQQRYALPCRLQERAQVEGLTRFRLLDVGSGMGTNLAAALAALESSACALEAVGLESDVEVLRTTTQMFEELDPGPGARFQRTIHAAFRQLLLEHDTLGEECESSAESPQPFHVLGPVELPHAGNLSILLGDGRLALPAWEPSWRCDGVFLDPFSHSSDATLWEPAFLHHLAQRMAPGSWLSTYSAAYRVREGLAQAGLRVGQGARLGAKAEGTLASPDGSPPALPDRIRRRLVKAGIEADWLA